MSIRRTIGIGLVALVGLSACAAFDREVEKRTPEASVDSVRIAGFDFDAARILVDLRVDNPNAIAIDIAGLDYELRLDGEHALSGDSAEQTSIPARGSGNLAVPITLDYRDLYDRFAGLQGRNTVDYAIDMGVMVDVPLLGQRRVPVSTSGSVPVPQRPGIAVRDLRVDRLGFDGARIVLDLDVTNPNAFDLALGALRYDLKVNDREWASGGLSDLARIDAGGRSRIAIPFDLDFAALGSGMYRMLLDGTRADYELNGLLSGTAGDDRFGPFDVVFEDQGSIGVGQ